MEFGDFLEEIEMGTEKHKVQRVVEIVMKVRFRVIVVLKSDKHGSLNLHYKGFLQSNGHYFAYPSILLLTLHRPNYFAYPYILFLTLHPPNYFTHPSILLLNLNLCGLKVF